MRPSLRILGLLCATLLLAACAAPQPVTPVIDESARSHDGLFPVRNTGDVRVWARADIDLSRYDELLPEGGGVRYAPTTRSSFPLDAAARARLEAMAASAFGAALAEVPGYASASAPGADVLVVRGTLIDVTSSVPTDDADVREVFLEDLGRATLVVELVDSESRAILLRAVETRRARSGAGLRRSVEARNWREVEGLLEAWGEDLRSALVQLRSRFTIAMTTLESANPPLEDDAS